jgi:hypothetical protein
MGYDSDEERKVHKGSVNLLALDKWDTSQLLVLKQQHNLVHPDGVLVDRTAIVVTGHAVPSGWAETHFETLHEAVEAAEVDRAVPHPWSPEARRSAPVSPLNHTVPRPCLP